MTPIIYLFNNLEDDESNDFTENIEKDIGDDDNENSNYWPINGGVF